MAGEGAGGGGLCGGGRELAGVLVRLDFASKSLGSKQAPMGRGGAGGEEGLEPEGGESEGVRAGEEVGVAEAGTVRGAAREPAEVAAPSGDGGVTLGGVVDVGGAEGRGGEGGGGLGGEAGRIEVGVGVAWEEREQEVGGGLCGREVRRVGDGAEGGRGGSGGGGASEACGGGGGGGGGELDGGGGVVQPIVGAPEVRSTAAAEVLGTRAEERG